MNRDNFDPSGFDIVRFLGKGGTANVYLARRLSDGRQFALKTLLVDDPVALSSFRPLMERELNLIGELNYPGLVRVSGVKDLGMTHPYLILEYCRGKTLDQIGRIESTEILLNIFSSICINLYFIHVIGIAHGDLKPHNIFLTSGLASYSNGHHIYTKISDFSLALKAHENNPTRLGMGTVGYIAPETIDGNKLDLRSDLFSLGIIGYILATGKHPFIDIVHEADPVVINSAIKESIPKPPVQLYNSVPAAFSELIMSMLSKSPDDRPPDAFKICQQLERQGCRYPYRGMIRPKHLLNGLKCDDNESFARNSIVNFSNDAAERIFDYSGDDRILFRNLLEMNFNTGSICWEDGKLTGKASKIVCPTRIMKHLGRDYSRLSFSERKNAILGAVIGRAGELSIFDISMDRTIPSSRVRPLFRLLENQISKATRVRFSNKLASRLLGNSAQVRLAAKLFLQGENLDNGFETVLDGINDLMGRNLHPEAFRFLQSLEQLCIEKNDIEKLKLVLMKRGDLEKMIGEVSNAEKTYLGLIGLYKGSPPDRILAETYKDLGDLYKMKQDYHSGIAALEKAREIYEKLDDKLELSHTLNNIGNIYTVSNDLYHAFKTFRMALHLQKRMKAMGDAASTLNNIAVLYYMRGRFGRAMRIFKLSLQLNREAGITVEVARSNNNIGYLYLESGQFASAREHLQESLQINRKINNKKEMLFNLDNLAQVNILLGSLKEALNYLREGRALAEELSDIPHRAAFTATTAMVQRRMGLYGSALESIKNALDMVRDLADRRDASFWYISLSEIYYDLHDSEKAVSSLRNAGRMILPDDRKALLNFHIAGGVIENDEAGFDAAAEIALQIKSPRDFWVAKIRKAWQYLKSDNQEKASISLEEASAKYNSPEPEIETARYHLIRGTEKLATGNESEAQIELEAALGYSTLRGLLPEVIEISVLLGKVNAKRSNFEAAYEFYKKAINGYKSIAEDIKDKELRKEFLSDEKIAYLAGEVKRLSQVLTQKRRAGL